MLNKIAYLAGVVTFGVVATVGLNWALGWDVTPYAGITGILIGDHLAS